MEADFINIHTHRPGRGTSIFDPCLGEAVLSGGGKVYYSLGIHPMFIGAETGNRFQQIVKAAKEGSIVAIGETGLDRNAPCSLAIQKAWFIQQVQVAAAYQLPLIIHGVRAIPEIIAVRKKYPTDAAWIMHGFNNRREVLLDLLRHDFYISAGRHVFNEHSPLYGLLPDIPIERLFIETDHSEWEIGQVYQKVAERRKLEIEVLKQKIAENFQRVFRV